MSFYLVETMNFLTTQLSSEAEFIVTTNVKTPIKITGVATTQIRDSKKDSWRNGYLVFYEDCGVIQKAEVNEELYSALHLVFDTLNNLDETDIVVENQFLLDHQETGLTKLDNDPY